MQTTFQVCKLYLLLCLGLSVNATPIITNTKTSQSNYQSRGSSSQHESSYFNHPDYENMEIKSNLQTSLPIDQNLKNIPGVTTTFKDQNGNLVTQVKKEMFNNENGQSSRAFEFQEDKQLPNGYSKSYKKEYSSSSTIGSQPTTVQNPINVEKYFNSKQQLSGASSTFGQSTENYQGPSKYSNTDYMGAQSNVKSFVDQSVLNVPGATTTFRDQYGNLVTQVKKEVINNENGQSTRAFEFQEDKQLPNGYSKNFKKEFSSSSTIGSQPTTIVQNPISIEKHFNSEQQLIGASSTFGQSTQNYQVPSTSSNTNYLGAQSNLKSKVDQSVLNVPGVTTTFRDQYGNVVTQVKKEVVNNENGQNVHGFEFEETKQLPNGYSKSYKKEFSSSSTIGSQPTTIVQNPINVEKYFDSKQQLSGTSSAFGQSAQNYQVPSKSNNNDYVGVQSNLKSTVDQSVLNVPGVTTTFRDQYGNLVTQVKKEVVNNDNGQNVQGFEFEETKQLPNGYSKSFKKEFSSSSTIGSQPTTIVQNPISVEKYFDSKQQLSGTSSTFEQSAPNYQVPSKFSNNGYVGVQSNLKSTADQTVLNVPGVTTIFRDQYGNLVTQVKKEVVNNNNGQNVQGFEFEETKQLPNSYSKSSKKEFSSSSTIGSQPTTIVQNPINVEKYYDSKQQLSGTSSAFGQSTQNYQVPLKSSNNDYVGVQSNLKSTADQTVLNVPGVTTTFRDQYGNLVTQVKKEVVNNDNGQTLHGFEFEETKQLPNGYSKSFKKEFSSSSVISANPTLIKDITTEKDAVFSQKNTNGEAQKLNGYNTFFNNQKYPLGSNSQISSQIIENQKTTNFNVPNKENSFAFNMQTQNIDCFDNDSSLSNQGITQQKENLKPSFIGQESVSIDYQQTTKKPLVGQQYGKIESFSTQTHEHVGQQSVDLHEFSKPSPVGQTSVNIDYQQTSNKPAGQFGKIEAFSTLTHEQVGQQSVDLHDFSKPSPIGQESVNIDYQQTSKKPAGQFGKIEAFSTLTHEQVGQQSVDLHDFSKPALIGQESVNIDYQFKPKKPVGQQFEKIESFSSQTHEQVGQQSVDLHNFSKPSPIGQESVNIDYQQTSKKPAGQFGKIEAFSTLTHEQVGQQSVDLYDFSKPSPVGQESVNIDYQLKPKKPEEQKFGKIEAFSTQTHEQVGQQSVDLHDFSKPSPVGQESVNIDYYQPIPKKPVGQHFEKIEAFTSQTHEQVGQQSVDIHNFSKPSPVGQESVNIDYQLASKKPAGEMFGKIEAFSTQTQEKVGQQSVDNDYLFKPKLPIGQQLEKTQTTYQNKYNFAGQQLVNNNENGKSNQQYDKSQQHNAQTTAGQQIQGLEFLTSNYGDTTHILDLGTPTRQQNTYNGKPLSLNKPLGQQTVGIFKSQSSLEKNIDLHNSDQNIPMNINNYQENTNINHQTYLGHPINSPALQGQQTVDFTGDYQKYMPTHQNQNYEKAGYQKSEFSTQPITSKYNTVFDKLGQLEHEILGAKSTVNVNKDNLQTSYLTNHNVKSMPVQTNTHESHHFSKTTNENTQYIEPESEIVSGINGEQFSSSSFMKETKSVVQQNTNENHTLDNEHFLDQTTTQSSVWKKIGNQFKGTIQNAKNKAQQLASTINDKVGFSK